MEIFDDTVTPKEKRLARKWLIVLVTSVSLGLVVGTVLSHVFIYKTGWIVDAFEWLLT